MTIRIGTSGWVYKHWRDVFYLPDLPARAWFAFYAREFSTVEINNSFYRLPSPEMFDAWRKQAPPDFLYAVKASRYITHMKKLKDPEEALREFLARAYRLEETLGPILYQLPPHWRVNLERLEAFLALLPPGYRHVIEFRDATWLIEPVFRLMERYHVAHCLHDMRPLDIPLRITAPPVYIRFHGDIHYEGDYSNTVLETWAQRIAGWNAQHLDVFAYFNNDPHGYAIKNARTLKEILRVG